MRIAAVDVVPYALPFAAPYVSARGRLDRRELVMVRLRTGEEVEGLGETVALSLRGGRSLGEIERQIRELAAPKLVGVDMEADPPGTASSVSRGLSREAATAVDTARLDLAAKLVDQPLWRLLGAKRAEPVPCNATLVAGNPGEVAADARRWAKRGFSSFKLKVGVPGDVEQVGAVREAVGPEARIRVDANGVWSPEQAVERLAAMEPFGIELAEQPAADLEELALVRARTAIPIAADESIASADDARRALELGSCQLATVKLPKVGGIGPARSIADALPVYLSSALDGPVGVAAAAHLAQALPGRFAGALAHGLATQLLFAGTVASTECEVHDGMLHLSEGPGLGVEIDERALERHRL
jgi:L-alanine-DL-glutamate epimerase-like enolase superfamily enzyme